VSRSTAAACSGVSADGSTGRAENPRRPPQTGRAPPCPGAAPRGCGRRAATASPQQAVRQRGRSIPSGSGQRGEGSCCRAPRWGGARPGARHGRPASGSATRTVLWAATRPCTGCDISTVPHARAPGASRPFPAGSPPSRVLTAGRAAPRRPDASSAAFCCASHSLPRSVIATPRAPHRRGGAVAAAITSPRRERSIGRPQREVQDVFRHEGLLVEDLQQVSEGRRLRRIGGDTGDDSGDHAGSERNQDARAAHGRRHGVGHAIGQPFEERDRNGNTHAGHGRVVQCRPPTARRAAPAPSSCLPKRRQDDSRECRMNVGMSLAYGMHPPPQLRDGLHRLEGERVARFSATMTLPMA
jgi:hypothetical protein